MYDTVGFSMVVLLGVGAVLLLVWLFLKPLVLGPSY